jgi:hypothetical protein
MARRSRQDAADGTRGATKVIATPGATPEGVGWGSTPLEFAARAQGVRTPNNSDSRHRHLSETAVVSSSIRNDDQPGPSIRTLPTGPKLLSPTPDRSGAYPRHGQSSTRERGWPPPSGARFGASRAGPRARARSNEPDVAGVYRWIPSLRNSMSAVRRQRIVSGENGSMNGIPFALRSGLPSRRTR